YTYPQLHKLTDTFWIKIPRDIINLKHYPEYKDRVEYIENRLNRTAVLGLHNVTENDEKEYCFRFITDKDKWTGKPGIQLHVSGLQVQAPPLVLEKETLNLTCRSPCKLTDRFVWHKNGQTLNFTRDILQFQSDRSDSGRYSCAVRGHEHLPSPAVNIIVEYPPKNVSVSVSPSEIVEGDSVTLTCSSDSNPPALNFSWFKEGTILQSGDTYSITNIKPQANGNYYCTARNKHGSQASAAVNVNVMYPPKSVSVSVSPSEIVEGDSVTLNCSSDSNPPALNFSWFKGETFVGSGKIFSILQISSDHRGEYTCRSRNKHGEKDSDAVMLNVMYTPRNVSVWVSVSGVIVEGDSVTLNCSSDSNPPALNFSWFKEDETSAVGSGQSFSISSFNSSFSGRFYCEAQNKYGSQRSASVSLFTVKGIQDTPVAHHV
ncbi:B-cell receptor CD22-like, partial [Siphateles boraxobius]|uniref:B-cell receptor CD22-like n=1 Tax=Siphateles boraxobius TaxID=180520 RepID=UPI004063748C